MDLLRPMRRVSAALLLLVAFAVQVQAAPIPGAHAAPDSTLQGDASSVMLGIDSDSHHEIRFKSVLQQIVQYQLLQIILTAGNTHTTSGGPYPVVGVYFYMVLSYHLQFLRCVNEALTCTAEPDPQSDGTRVRIDIGSLAANVTEEVEIEVSAVEVGEASITSTLYQQDFDPNTANNKATLYFTISEAQPGAVRGFKFEDLNGDGQWDEDEPGLDDWTMRLLQEDSERTTVTATMDGLGDGILSPLETGWFVFEDVPAGEYQLHEDLPEGWVQSAPEDAYYDVTVAEGQTAGDYVFGNFRPGRIMGSVFEDANADGSFGGDDGGLANHEVRLNGTTGKGEVVSRTTTTNGDGAYAFSNLDPGSYTVSSTAPPALPEPTALPATIALISGMEVEGADFGFGDEAAPRLELSIEPDAVQTVVGALIPFTVTVTNTGNAPAVAVDLGIGWFRRMYAGEFDGLPGDCTNVGGIITEATNCPIGDLAPAASRHLIFDVRVRGASNTDYPGLTRISGTAEAANHPRVFEDASIQVEDLGIDFGAFKAKAVGGRKTAEGEVDVYLDSLLVLSSLGEGSAYPFTQVGLASTDPMLHVVPAGETDLSQAMLVKELSLSEGEGEAFSLPTSYFLVLTDTDALVVRDAQFAPSDEGMVSFAVVHAAPALGTVDVHHPALGALTLQAGDATGYEDVAPGHHVIEVRESGASDILDSYTFDWTASAGMSFVIVLSDALSGTALQAVAADGTVLEAAESTQHEAVALPDRITLYTNYPNPFNPTTTISYSLPIADEVRVEVFDALGRQVALLADGVRQAGRHEVRFNAEALPSGMYVYRLSTSAHVEARTMVVLK